MKHFLITIDGPAGAGKTTVSRMLSNHLGYRYIDTGALYRAVALEAKQAGINPDDEKGLGKLCKGLNLKFVMRENKTYLLSNGKEIGEQIRTPEITMLSSAVSAKPIVRAYLLDLQREMGKEKGVVFEGRDMGTVVFPDADVKFFLDASLKTRASRRHKEFLSKNNQSFEDVELDMKRRDENDSKRKVAPLKPAEDAIIIDSTALSVQEVVEQMLGYIQ